MTTICRSGGRFGGTVGVPSVALFRALPSVSELTAGVRKPPMMDLRRHSVRIGPVLSPSLAARHMIRRHVAATMMIAAATCGGRACQGVPEPMTRLRFPRLPILFPIAPLLA